MTSCTDEIRPCVVNGSRALFHCWAGVEKPNIVDGKQVGRWKTPVAIIECLDGTVQMVPPDKVRFMDSDKQFAKYDRREDDE